METALGCGYSINEESALTDFYSPPTSIIDEEEEEDLFYPEEEDIPSTFEPISQTDLRDQLQSLPLKLMSIGTAATPPTTPQNCLDPLQSTIMDFQKMKILPDLSSDRHCLFEPPGMSNASSDLHVERSRLYSYLNPMEDSMMIKSSNFSRPVQSFFPYTNNHSLQDSWFLSDLVRQNNQQISLSTTAQQILNGNNRPLRSEKIDIEVIKHLIREANWKRQCGMKKEVGESKFLFPIDSIDILDLCFLSK